jgi:two-component system sensor histidine kinase RegB
MQSPGFVATPDALPAGLFSDRWLVSLRWWFAALQAVALLVAERVFHLDLPLQPLLIFLAVGLASNGALAWWVRRRTPGAGRGRELSSPAVAGVLSLDVLLLMAMLAWSGGAHNPFSVAALVQVTLAATLLPPRWTWAVVAVAVLGYGALFAPEGAPGLLPWSEIVAEATDDMAGELAGMGAPCPHCAAPASGLSLHLQGMWMAFVLAAGLVAHFVGRVSASLRAHGRALVAMGEAASRHRRLEALTTLAAGAAHELATPIGTIALVAGELAGNARREGAPAEVLEDLALLSDEVARCRAILDRMGGAAQGLPAELPVVVTMARIGADVQGRLLPEQAARLRLALDDTVAALAPPEALARTLLTLVSNAFDASAADGEVRLSAKAAPTATGEIQVCFEVRDTGVGMEAELLARACEPFVSTKQPGRGMGLGLYLAHRFAQDVGGSLTLNSAPGQGTTVRLWVPKVLKS